MWIKTDGKQQIEESLAQLRAELNELEGHLPRWVGENTSGTQRYRPLARRIILSARRLQELVRENTYRP
jgi:hypothetical protein